MCILLQTKNTFCLNYEPYFKEIRKLRLFFDNNGYFNRSINLPLFAAKNNSQNPEKNCFLLSGCSILKILLTNLLKTRCFGENKI